MGATHLPDHYKARYRPAVVVIKLDECLEFISNVIETAQLEVYRTIRGVYYATFIKIMLRYLIKNGNINDPEELINVLSKLYKIDTTIYYNNMFLECFYRTVNMFKSMIRMYNIIDVVKVEVKNRNVIIEFLTIKQ